MRASALISKLNGIGSSSLGVAALLAYAPAAWAQACPAPYTHDQWAKDLDAIAAQMANFQLAEASTGLKATQKSVICLDKVAEPAHLGRFARTMSLMFFYQQEEDASVRWANLQRFAAPGLTWTDKNLVPVPPYKDMLEWADEPPMGGDPDGGLAIPKKGAAFINGAWANAPLARAEVPNFIQLADAKGNIVTAYWQDGARFRPDQLGPPLKGATAPGWFTRATWPAVADNHYGFAGDDAMVDGGEEDPILEAPEPVKPPEPV